MDPFLFEHLIYDSPHIVVTFPFFFGTITKEDNHCVV